jgi:hypothetical protein
MAARKSRQAGNAMIEFAFVGIPMIFVLISIFEMARGMWLYHTMAYAMKEGARFAIVHGNNCNAYPNKCTVTIQDIATRIRDAAVGIPASDLKNVTFNVYDLNGNPVNVIDDTGAVVGNKQLSYLTLQDCLDSGGSTYWPAGAPGTGDAQGADQFYSRVEITGQYPFQSALSMLWPGAKGMVFGTVWFSASSRETIQF